jgi:hypothetical protein
MNEPITYLLGSSEADLALAHDLGIGVLCAILGFGLLYLVWQAAGRRI